MTVRELVEQIDQLPTDDQRKILEILKHRFSEDEEEVIDIHEEFRQAWREAMTGEEIPLSELWDALNAE